MNEWIPGKDLRVGDVVHAYRGSCNATKPVHRIVPGERVVDITTNASPQVILESGVTYFTDLWDRHWLVERAP